MCPDLEELSAYIDGELSKSDSQTIEAHIKECEICRAELESFTLFSQKIVEDIPFVPEGLEAKIRDRVLHTNVDFRQTKKPSWFKGVISIPAPIAIAAGLVLLLTTTFTALNNFSGNEPGLNGGGSVAVEDLADQQPRKVAMNLAEEIEIEMEVPLDLNLDVDNIYFGDSEIIKEEVVLNE